MGLDITAYRQIKPAPDAPREDGCVIDWENHFDVHSSSLEFTEENWPGHSDGIKPGAYTFAKAMRFRAGSYSGYGEWRQWLARVAGWTGQQCWDASPEERAKHPFSELVNFADNEGVIGPKVAAKLAKDFADNEMRAREMTAAGEDWFFQQYQKWREAFEMAADSGAIDFH